MEKIDSILQELSQKRITTEQAIDKINKIQQKPTLEETSITKSAKKIKISICTYENNKKDNVKINLPGISIKFATRILNFILKQVSKKSKNEHFDLNDKQNIELIKVFIKALTDLPPFEIVTVNSDDANIHIYTY